MANFSAKEVLRQSRRIEEQLKNFDISSSTIITQLEKMASDVQAEDSDLTQTLKSTVEVYREITSAMDIFLGELSRIMDVWATNTAKNEGESLEDLTFIASNIEDLPY